ncbi:MAG: hypothetical protein J6X55_05695, partial [Victivallales bacterium]|nr:hypothetical protein [Victivallales bacterium]
DSYESNWRFELSQSFGDITNVAPEDMMAHSRNETPNGDVVLKWKGHPTYGLNFTVTTTWKHCDDGRMEGRLEYSDYEGTLDIEKIVFPIVKMEVYEDFDILTHHGFIVPSRLHTVGKRYEALINCMQFCAFLNHSRDSLYIDWRDPSWTAKGYYFQLLDSTTLCVSGIYYVPIEKSPANSGCIPYPCSIADFKGGWYDASQIYKPWAIQQAWWTKADRPNKLADIGMWVWNRGLIKDVLPPVERLQKDLGRDARVALDWYWWHNNPYDTDYPNFWPPREGAEAFKEAAKRLTSQNIFCQVYINGICWDHDTANWEDGGRQGAVVKRDGTLHEHDFNKYNHHRLCWMCSEAEAFQNQHSFLVKTLREAGMTGQYMDMIGNSSFALCYNREHHHPLGGGTHKVEGYRKFLKRLLDENPGHPIDIESPCEPYMDLASGCIICAETSSERMGNTAEAVPTFTAVYHGRYALFGNYALPDGIPPWDPLWPDKDKWPKEESWHTLYPDEFYVEMARFIVWGSQPMVCTLRDNIISSPEFAEEYNFILASARFYSANLDFLYSGEMLSPDGFSCPEKDVSFFYRMIFTTQDKAHPFTRRMPTVLHSHWRNPAGQTALFLANYTADEQPWSFKGLSGTIAPHSYLKVKTTSAD